MDCSHKFVFTPHSLEFQQKKVPHRCGIGGKKNSLRFGRLLFSDEGITTVAGRRLKVDEALSFAVAATMLHPNDVLSVPCNGGRRSQL
jgi:hypothetical protein